MTKHERKPVIKEKRAFSVEPFSLALIFVLLVTLIMCAN